MTSLGLESAQDLLGIVLVDPSRFREIAHVRPEHFGEPAHGHIWSVIEAIVRAGALPDIATVADRLVANPLVAELGGRAFISNLWDKAPAATLARQKAQEVLDAFVRRSGASLLAEAATRLLDPAAEPTSAALAALRDQIDRLAAHPEFLAAS
jgi:replicative DNA helicase